MTAIQTLTPQAVEVTAPDFESLVAIIETTIAPSSARVYRQTYEKWRTWAAGNGLSPFALTPSHVSDFLNSQDVTKATKQRWLSALRKFVEMLSILDYQNAEWAALHGALSKVKANGSGGGKERRGRALSPAEADKVLRAWDGNTAQDIRNRALIAVLFLGGLRRSETAALKWSDVDFAEGIVTVRHGKGDKRREVPLMGDFALHALARWREVTRGRVYVFCPLDRSKDRIGADKPMPDTDVYRIVKATEKRAGVPFAPHDARRTLLTEYIDQTGDLPGAQAIAGHAHSSTTLGYASPATARDIRRKARLRYG